MANLKLIPHDIVESRKEIVDWFILGFWSTCGKKKFT
jgi:hypothetical protein